MTPERFTHLADAYGADLQRWPASERAGAQALLAEGNAELLEALNRRAGSMVCSIAIGSPHRRRS